MNTSRAARLELELIKRALGETNDRPLHMQVNDMREDLAESRACHKADVAALHEEIAKREAEIEELNELLSKLSELAQTVAAVMGASIWKRGRKA